MAGGVGGVGAEGGQGENDYNYGDYDLSEKNNVNSGFGDPAAYGTCHGVVGCDFSTGDVWDP